MKFLNIHIFEDEDKKGKSLKIRLDLIDRSTEKNYEVFPSDLNNIKDYIHNPMRTKIIIKDIYRCSNEEIFRSALSPSSSSDKPYSHTSVTYKLSTIPYIAIYQFWALVSRILTKKQPHIYFNKQLSEQLIGDGGMWCELPIEFDKENNVSEKFDLPYFMRQILQFKHIESYKHSMEALNKMLDFYIENLESGGKFIDLLEVEKRCMNSYTKLTKTCLEPEINISKKLNALLNQARNLIHEGQKEELNFQINSIHSLAKKKLIAPFLGKKSHEGFIEQNNKTYNADYTELSFIENAELFLRADKRMSIINIQTNKEYIRNYAKGKGNHGILKEELMFLGPIIGLEFDQDSDYENEIIFTPDCSRKLQAMDLHLTLNYIKSLLHAQNQSTFFAKSAQSEQSAGGKNLLTHLPMELYPSLVDQLQPLDEEELSHCAKPI